MHIWTQHWPSPFPVPNRRLSHSFVSPSETAVIPLGSSSPAVDLSSRGTTDYLSSYSVHPWTGSQADKSVPPLSTKKKKKKKRKLYPFPDEPIKLLVHVVTTSSYVNGSPVVSCLAHPFCPFRVMLEALLALHKVIVNSPNVQWLLKLSVTW